MKLEWNKNWHWGLEIFPRYCSSCPFDADRAGCMCEDTAAKQECGWDKGPRAWLYLMIGPDIGDMETFEIEITMEALKKLYKNFYIEDWNKDGFKYDPGIYPVGRRRLNDTGCTNHSRIFEDCPACRRLLRIEKASSKRALEEKEYKEMLEGHSSMEEKIIADHMAVLEAWEQKRARESSCD
jgi:hypothetical protein